jgi:hypothetical protein
MMTSLVEQQRCCADYGAEWSPPPSDFKVSIARSVLPCVGAFHGARRRPSEGDSGWYVWAGDEYSDDPTYFVHVSVASLREWCPSALKFLALPAGWRFEMSEDGERAWPDPQLLEG